MYFPPHPTETDSMVQDGFSVTALSGFSGTPVGTFDDDIVTITGGVNS